MTTNPGKIEQVPSTLFPPPPVTCTRVMVSFVVRQSAVAVGGAGPGSRGVGIGRDRVVVVVASWMELGGVDNTDGVGHK